MRVGLDRLFIKATSLDLKLSFKQNKPYKKAKHGPPVMRGPDNSAKSKNLDILNRQFFSHDSGTTRCSTGDDWQSKFSNH